MKTYENRDAPRLDASTCKIIEDMLRRRATAQVMLGPGGKVQVLEVKKKIVYRAL